MTRWETLELDTGWRRGRREGFFRGFMAGLLVGLLVLVAYESNANDCNAPVDDRAACTCEADGYVWHCPAIPDDATSWSNCSKHHGDPQNFAVVDGKTTWVSCAQGDKVPNDPPRGGSGSGGDGEPRGSGDSSPPGSDDEPPVEVPPAPDGWVWWRHAE